MNRAKRLDKLEVRHVADYEVWLRSLTQDEFMAYYADLVRSDPEQMAYLATLTQGQLQKRLYMCFKGIAGFVVKKGAGRAHERECYEQTRRSRGKGVGFLERVLGEVVATI